MQSVKFVCFANNFWKSSLEFVDILLHGGCTSVGIIFATAAADQRSRSFTKNFFNICVKVSHLVLSHAYVSESICLELLYVWLILPRVLKLSNSITYPGTSKWSKFICTTKIYLLKNSHRWGTSNEYPKHCFLREIREKIYIIIWILYIS